MNTPAKGSVTLVVAVFIALALLMLIEFLTENRISQARQQMLLDTIAAVLPEGPFDQNPIESVKVHRAPELGGTQPLKLYTAFRNTQPKAAVLELLAPDGYSGNIRILLGLHADGTIVAVRVIEHTETPGLGDRIEYRKSQWISQFDGQAAFADASVTWQPRQSGGQYDALSGATITSRAIMQSIHRALVWFQEHREEVFLP